MAATPIISPPSIEPLATRRYRADGAEAGGLREAWQSVSISSGFGCCAGRQLLDEDEVFDGEVYRTNRTAPIEIPQLRGLTKLAAGAHHGVALKDDYVYTWGQNADGQLGNGNTTDSHTMLKVLSSDSSTTDVTASLGGNSTYVH